MINLEFYLQKNKKEVSKEKTVSNSKKDMIM
jgi:hypothetical protein